MKPRCLLPLALSLLAALGPTRSLVGAEASVPMKITTIEGITEYRLENGLKVLLFPDPSKPHRHREPHGAGRFPARRLRRSRHGPPARTHAVQGDADPSQHPQVAAGPRGAEFNGTTWLDRTNYYETLPANDDNLEFAISLEADRMINSFVRGEDLASEMTVVRNEFERGENTPPICARPADERRGVRVAQLREIDDRQPGRHRAGARRKPAGFYRKYYQPDNAMLIVAGQFDEQKALTTIGKHFGIIPRPERVLENTYTEEPAQDGERIVTLRRVGDVAWWASLYHIPRRSPSRLPRRSTCWKTS